MSAQSESFRHHYAQDQIRPWESGSPQPAIVEVAHMARGVVLDAGCGTGEHALFFAERGHLVWAADGAEEAIAIAKEKAAIRGLDAHFSVRDLLEPSYPMGVFGTVIDSGLLHCFDEAQRATYVERLAWALHPGGLLILLCYADFDRSGIGPRRISRDEIRSAFAGWDAAIIASEIKLHPSLQHMEPAGAWLALLRRK